MLRRLPTTPCPIVDRIQPRFSSIGGGEGGAGGDVDNGNYSDDGNDDGNNTTANLDFTTEFKASFRNVKPRRPPTARPRRGVPVAAAAAAAAAAATAAARVSDDLGFTIHEDEPLCISNRAPDQKEDNAQKRGYPKSQSGGGGGGGGGGGIPTIKANAYGNYYDANDDTLPAVPSPTIAKPARRRRATIYIPNDDTTMPTVYMGLFSPLKTGRLQQQQQKETVQEEQAEKEVEEHTGLVALMLKKRSTPAAPLQPPKRQPVLVASPKRGYRPPLGSTSTRPFQVTATNVEDRRGSGPGKENVPPGYTSSQRREQQQQQEGEEALMKKMMMKKPRKSAVVAGGGSNASLGEERLSLSSSASRSVPPSTLFQRTASASSRLKPACNAAGARPPAAAALSSSLSSSSSKPIPTRAPLSQPKASKPRSKPTRPEAVVQAQIKQSVPTRFVVPLVKVESVDKSFPLLSEGLPEVSLYEDNWLGQQEVAITQLLNSLFTASSACMDDAAAPGILRLRLLAEYNKPDVALMHKRVQGALLYGALSIPQQGGHGAGYYRLYDDLGRRKAFTDLWLETYDNELLKTALEVVIGRAVNAPQQSSASASTTSSSNESDAAKLKKRLKLFIEVFLMRNEDVTVAEGEFDGKSSSSSSSSSYSRTLLRSLMLIKVLDLAKASPALSKAATPLFLATSPYKTSLSVLQALMQMLNPSAGDPVRALAHLGFSVSHEQHALEEYDYQITNLAVDLRDGVRLVRLVELLLYRSASSSALELERDADTTTTTAVLTSTDADVALDNRHDRVWPMSRQLKVPCIGRATKLFNVQIALTALAGVKGLEPVIRDISAEDIVDGFREKTMKLLWSLTSKWGLEGLLDWSDVQCEIGRLGRAAGKVGYSFFSGHDSADDNAYEGDCGHGRPDNDGKGGHQRYTKYKTLLQEWVKSVAALHGLTVRNLTTSFANGRVFEAIVDHYTPYLPSAGLSATNNAPCLSERLKALGCGDQFAQLFATGPGAAGKHHIFDRDFTLASLAFLCSRLLGPSKRARAATVLQRAWRRRREVVRQRKAEGLQGLAHACADTVRSKENRQREAEVSDIWIEQ